MAQTYVSSHSMGSYTKLTMIRYMCTNTCQYMCTKRFYLWTLAMAQTSVRVHSTGWYTNVSVIWFLICILVSTCMYTKTFWVWALARLQTYVSLHNMDSHIKVSLIWYVYLWVYACIQRGSKCEHSQENRHMWVRTTRSHTRKYSICNSKYVYLWAYVCIQRGSKCEHSQGHRRLWVRTTWAHIQISLWCDLCILASICMYTKRF